MFSLFFAVTCAGLTYTSKGIFICGGDTTAVRFHIPTEQKGSARIIDQDTDYGIFDFNIAYKEKGFWLFKRKFLPVQDTPIIDVSNGAAPITIGVFSELSGKQFAFIDSFKPTGFDNAFKVEYKCGGRKFNTGEKNDWSFGQNVGGCSTLVDSTFSLKVLHDITATRTSIEGCGISKTITSNNYPSTEFSFKVLDGICPVYIQIENKLYRQRVKFLIQGIPRDSLSIDKPVLLENKVFKPVGATLLTGEWYNKGKIQKRFSTTSDEYSTDWFNEGHLCLFAHSNLGMSSEICYDSNRNELPMSYFR